jgi:branched-chain amino acid transport system substrate-binding protein
VFADLWEHLGPARTVGCLWNDGTQGQALRRWFRPVAESRGHRLVDLSYREHGGRLPDLAGVEVVTSAATASDLAAAVDRVDPRLVTCSRWLTYPFSVARHGLDRIATIVYWTPQHAHRGSGQDSSQDLAAAFEAATGELWLQPLGVAHALMEATCRVVTATDSRVDTARALTGTRMSTLAGVLDWSAGPTAGVATIPLAAGQWRTGTRPDLVVVDNRRAPAVPVNGELLLSPRS